MVLTFPDIQNRAVRDFKAFALTGAPPVYERTQDHMSMFDAKCDTMLLLLQIRGKGQQYQVRAKTIPQQRSYVAPGTWYSGTAVLTIRRAWESAKQACDTILVQPTQVESKLFAIHFTKEHSVRHQHYCNDDDAAHGVHSHRSRRLHRGSSYRSRARFILRFMYDTFGRNRFRLLSPVPSL